MAQGELSFIAFVVVICVSGGVMLEWFSSKTMAIETFSISDMVVVS